MQTLLEKWLGKTVASQAKYYNSKHLPCEYNVKDHVYLNGKNIDSTHLTKKLDWKYYGPYPVVKCIEKVAYRLNLSELIKIHNVFHVLLLKLYNNRRGSVPSPPLIDVNRENKFEIKKILDSRSHYGKQQYLIKWVGYAHSDNQWITKKQIADLKKLVQLLYRLYSHKPSENKEKKIN